MIVILGLPCTVYREPGNKHFSQRAQQGISVAIGEEVEGYTVYLPKDKNVVTSKRVRNIETLSKTHNLQVQRLYHDEDEAEVEEEAEEQGSGTADQSVTSMKNDAKGRAVSAEATQQDSTQ
ncbi:Copialike retrotransposable element [Phytophthora palmivora]|uniref:Copialike retrotransposable element n=1 Tax=Phytophthora palmivora TaxID=4796 RepID=A0A2P4XVB5_9STRA|nr:Copialike retrotransposable element [Phytophthora palmivora]